MTTATAGLIQSLQRETKLLSSPAVATLLFNLFWSTERSGYEQGNGEIRDTLRASFQRERVEYVLRHPNTVIGRYIIHTSRSLNQLREEWKVTGRKNRKS